MNMIEFYGYSNAISAKDTRIDMRQNWLAFWEKLAILTNAPFDTINTMKQFEQKVQEAQKQQQQQQQLAGMESMEKAGTIYKNVMEGEKIRRTA